jgi:hypothetical protein
MLNTITIKAKVFICTVHGFENAIRVAKGIAHEQAEYVKYPAFNPFEEVA